MATQNPNSMLKAFLFLIFLSGLIVQSLFGQNPINIPNSSFDVASAATLPVQPNVPFWRGCVFEGMENESPPDHFSGLNERFNIRQIPFHGNAYLSMVTRENGTWEAVSEKLDQPLLKDQCYRMVIYLSHEPEMLSPHGSSNGEPRNFGNPVILRIWGANTFCRQENLLMQVPPVSHEEWRKYKLLFRAPEKITHLMLEVNYVGQYQYFGSMLLDHLTLAAVPCSDLPDSN